MSKQRRFTKEFEAEAVRLVETSGRTQRKIADDLGVGLSTLVRWIGRSRDRQIDHPPEGTRRPDDLPVWVILKSELATAHCRLSTQLPP